MSFQSALAMFQRDWLGRQMLFMLEPYLRQIATNLISQDPYGEVVVLRSCMKLLNGNDSDAELVRWCEHRLWCCCRESSLTSNKAELDVHMDSQSANAIAETANVPTIILAPMTLAQNDALFILRRLFPDRPVMVYGEGIDALDEMDIAGGGLKAVRNILSTLSGNGVLATYSDFVYSNHQSVSATFFNTCRPFSSGLLSLAMMPDTCVLPMVFNSTDQNRNIEVFAEEPFGFGGPSVGTKFEKQKLAAQIFAQTLERLIARCPEQWLLLPTLQFESPQLSKINP